MHIDGSASKAFKKILHQLALQVPTSRFFTLVLTTQDTRPAQVDAATPRVSSIGIRKYPAAGYPSCRPAPGRSLSQGNADVFYGWC